jgi:hypothetical protein
MYRILLQMLEFLDTQLLVRVHERHFRAFRVVMLVEAGTHLIVDALICPYRIGERIRAKKLLRSVTQGMLLMWDARLHSYTMVQATLATGCDYLGRVPANVKLRVEKVLDDGSYRALDLS